MKKLVALLSFCCLILLSAHAQATLIPGSQRTIGAWSGGAYTFDNTGKFSHCAVSATYRSGILMTFAVSENYTWRVGWSHPSWNLNGGQKVDIALYIDGAGPEWVTAVAINHNMALAELPANARLFDLFRRGYHLTVTALGNRYDFNLSGTYAALTDLANCVAEYRPGAQPSSSAPPPMTGAGRPQSTPQSTPGAGSLTTEERLEATTLVANLLAQGDLNGYRILTAKEVQEIAPGLSSWHVVWRADNVLGTMKIIPKSAAESVSAISSAMIASDSRGCKGQFASGTTPDDKSKGTTRLFVACKSDKLSWETHYIIVPRDSGGFYLFGTFGESQSADAAQSVDHADGLLRAAVFQVLKH